MSEVNMRHTRADEQRALYRTIEADGRCSFCVDFCQGHAPQFHPKPILRETAYWALTENMTFYAGAQLQLLLVYKEHVFGPPLPPEAWTDLGALLEWAVKEYRLPAGGFYFRFGDTDYTGASVRHFHANIIYGGGTDGDPVKVKLGYAKK